MKSFSHFLQELNDGATHAGITADMAELLRTVQNTGRSGSVTIKVKVSPATKSQSLAVDKITVTVDRKLELPKPEQPTDFFWLTDEGETSRQHPRQHALELREVATPATVHAAVIEALQTQTPHTTDADGVIHFKKV